MKIELTEETKLFIRQKIEDKDYLIESFILYWLGRLDKINYYYLPHLDLISAYFLPSSAGYSGNKGQSNIMINEDQNGKKLARELFLKLKEV